MMKIILDEIILSVEAERFSVRAGLGNVYNEICRNVVSGRYFALPIQTQIITVCHNLLKSNLYSSGSSPHSDDILTGWSEVIRDDPVKVREKVESRIRKLEQSQ